MDVVKGIKRMVAGLRLVAQRRAINRGGSFNAEGFQKWRVGDATITKIVELEGEGFGEFLFPQATKSLIANEALPTSHIGRRGGLKLAVQSFVVETNGKRILVDTNVGNGKRRSVPIWNKLTTPWLDDLVNAGYPPNTIDLVICTHLHIDHVGWNTRYVDGTWVPTFPNATYMFARREYEYWMSRLDNPERAALFADSITPIANAGQMELVDTDAEIAPGVFLALTPGHTEHHASVLIQSGQAKAMITGDFIHHTIQFSHPEWASSFDTSPETSVKTRHEWFERMADENILVLGTAFPHPTAGYVKRKDGGYAFTPETHQ